MGRKVAPRQKCHSPGGRDNVTITNIWVMLDVDVLFPACALEGSGRGDVFAQGCFAVRNRPQLSATACNVRNAADMAILKALKREAYHFLWQALHLDYNILRSCVENSSLRPILAHLRL